MKLTKEELVGLEYNNSCTGSKQRSSWFIIWSLTVASKRCIGTSIRTEKAHIDISFSGDISYLSDSHSPGIWEIPVSNMLYLCLVVLDSLFLACVC